MSFVKEFKEFINRGNVMDMAVGVIIGGAFTTIVSSLTDDIINPFIKLITGGSDTEIAGLTIPVAGTENGIDFGAFISAIINFLIIAFIVFWIVKVFNKMRSVGEKPTVKMDAAACPLCKEEVKEGATRCPHCTGEIPASYWDARKKEKEEKERKLKEDQANKHSIHLAGSSK